MFKDKPLIIGITGAFGSGKSTASDFFEFVGFKKIILSSFLEKEAKKRGYTKITRKILQDIGNELREKCGSGILAKRANEFSEKIRVKKIVVDGIRNLGEIKELRKNENFILLAIVANRKLRFKRLKNLKRREALTWNLFEKLDKRDLGIGERSTGLQVAFCIASADFFIDNNGKVEKFEIKLRKFLENI